MSRPINISCQRKDKREEPNSLQFWSKIDETIQSHSHSGEQSDLLEVIYKFFCKIAYFYFHSILLLIPFLRLNSLEYQNLQDKVRGPIQNIENIHIYKSVTERFIEVFREEVEKNPRTTVNEVRIFISNSKFCNWHYNFIL